MNIKFGRVKFQNRRIVNCVYAEKCLKLEMKKLFFEIQYSRRDHVETNPVRFHIAKMPAFHQTEPIHTIASEWILMRSFAILHKIVRNIYGVD